MTYMSLFRAESGDLLQKQRWGDLWRDNLHWSIEEVMDYMPITSDIPSWTLSH